MSESGSTNPNHFSGFKPDESRNTAPYRTIPAQSKEQSEPHPAPLINEVIAMAGTDSPEEFFRKMDRECAEILKALEEMKFDDKDFDFLMIDLPDLLVEIPEFPDFPTP